MIAARSLIRESTTGERGGEWTRTAVAYFGAVAFGIAQPVYHFTLRTRAVVDLRLPDALVLILIVHLGTTGLLLVARALAGPLRRSVDTLVYAGMALLLLRQAQSTYATPRGRGLPAWVEIAILAAGAALVVALAYLLRRHLPMYMLYLGILSAYFPAHFLSLHLPAWPAPAVEPRQDRTPQDQARPDGTIFIVVLDEVSLEILLTPSGTIDQVAFPNLHSFSRESLWFRQAITNYALTGLSIPSLLAGSFVRPAHGSGFADVNDFPRANVLSVLADEGYHVNFYSRAFGCRPGFVTCVRFFRGSPIETVRRVVTAAANAWVPPFVGIRLAPALSAYPKLVEGRMLSGLARSPFARPGEASLFHLLIAHAPYVLSSDGEPVASGDYGFARYSRVEPTVHRYREQMRYLDRSFGSFVGGLKESGAWERSVIVVTADHGTCWKPGCMGRVGIEVAEPSLTRIPMMIRTPSRPPGIVDGDYQHVDFAATLLDALGVLVNGGVGKDGRSALVPASGRRRPFFVGEHPIDVGFPSRPVKVPSSELEPPGREEIMNSGG